MKLRTRFVLAALACSLAFAQAETYIVTPMPKEAWKVAKGKKLVVEPLRTIELGRFKKEFERRYGGEEGFRKTFMEFLSERFGKTASDVSPEGVRLELISLGYRETFIPSHKVTIRGSEPHFTKAWGPPVGGGGIPASALNAIPGHGQHNVDPPIRPTDSPNARGYGDWRPDYYQVHWELRFRLIQGEKELLSGRAEGLETDGEGAGYPALLDLKYEYNAPGRLRLPSGMEELQEHLADFVTGHPSTSHVMIADDPKP